jgi:intracellular multiplication protein IcmL
MAVAVEDRDVVRLKSDFYRDGYRKIVLCLGLIIAAIILLIASCIYLYVTEPPPVYFSTDKEWRILPPVSVELPYLISADLLQWVGHVMMGVFYYDFVNYQDQLQDNRSYFTDKGWLAFQGMINNYASNDMVSVKKIFVNGAPNGAPFVLNEGLLEQRYAWWVQIPMKITYTYIGKDMSTSEKQITFQILVVRIPTLNNIYGVAIDNIKLLTNKTATGTPNA